MAFELTPAQIDRFNEDGFLVVDKLIDDETVAAVSERYEKLFRGEFETGVLPDEVNWQEGESDPSLTRQICNAWKADRTIASVVMRADLGKAIATLGGWPGARLMVDNVLWKPPGTRPLALHQDNAYLHWFQPTELLSCWMALDDTRGRCGNARVRARIAPLASLTPRRSSSTAPRSTASTWRRRAATEGVEPEIVHVEVPKGGGSFHHGWTWHGSGDNTATVPRRSLVLHAMRSDTRYVPECLGPRCRLDLQPLQAARRQHHRRELLSGFVDSRRLSNPGYRHVPEWRRHLILRRPDQFRRRGHRQEQLFYF